MALLSGFGGGNFAPSMSNISSFYPKRVQGYSLGLYAGLGNFGVTTMQATSGVVPIPGRPHVADVARAPQPSPVSDLGSDEHHPQALSPAASLDHALTDACGERTCQVRIECVSRTCSGLWGAGRSNAPAYPALSRACHAKAKCLNEASRR